jgi:ribosomal protein L44E
MRPEEVKDSPPSKKRKNEEPHEENGLPSKLVAAPKTMIAPRHSEKSGKRARVSYSCSECHRRKQKVVTFAHGPIKLTISCIIRSATDKYHVDM